MRRKPVKIISQGFVESVTCERGPGMVHCKTCQNVGPCVMDRYKPDQALSSGERMGRLQDYIAQESGWNPPKTVFGTSIYNPCQQAFIEGCLAMLAFCSGSISGGRLRELAGECYGHEIDTHALNNYAKSVMERTYKFWEDDKI